MTVNQNNLTVRPIAGREGLDLFLQLPYVLDHEMAGDLDAGRRRPEWMWIAQQGDRVLARAAWWGRPEDDAPLFLDCFDIEDSGAVPDRVDVGVRLLSEAMLTTLPAGTRPPEYTRFLPQDWRQDAASRRVVEERMAVLERLGARLFVERLRLRWLPEAPPPEPRGRLTFRPVRDTEELLSLMTRALQGTLDAHDRDELTRLSPREVATRHYEEELAHYTSPRTWWRVATLPDGEPVGFVIPARNAYHPIIAYLAVLSEYRGRGYVDEILVEGTRVLAGQNAERVHAATDVGNVPMARAFQRAGYVTFQRAITMNWDQDDSKV